MGLLKGWGDKAYYHMYFVRQQKPSKGWMYPRAGMKGLVIPAPSLRVWRWASRATSLCLSLLYEMEMTVPSSSCCLRTKWLEMWKHCPTGYPQVWPTLHRNSSCEDLAERARTCCLFRNLTTANIGQVHGPRHVAVPLHYPDGKSTRVFEGRKRTDRSPVSKHLPNFSVPLYKEAESWVTKCEWKLFPAL